MHLTVLVGQRGPQTEGAGGAHGDIGVGNARVVEEEVAASFEHDHGLRVLHYNQKVHI